MKQWHGNEASKGFVNRVEAGPGWSLLIPSPSEPPPENEISIALNHALEQWLRSDPTVRV